MSLDMNVAKELYFYKVDARYGDGSKETRIERMIVK